MSPRSSIPRGKLSGFPGSQAPSTREPSYAAPLKIEAPPCHFAGVVSRQTSPANVRPYGVDRARGRYAHLSHQSGTAITAAAHPPQVAIDIRLGNSVEIGVAFQ